MLSWDEMRGRWQTCSVSVFRYLMAVNMVQEPWRRWINNIYFLLSFRLNRCGYKVHLLLLFSISFYYSDSYHNSIRDSWLVTVYWLLEHLPMISVCTFIYGDSYYIIEFVVGFSFPVIVWFNLVLVNYLRLAVYLLSGKGRKGSFIWGSRCIVLVSIQKRFFPNDDIKTKIETQHF